MHEDCRKKTHLMQRSIAEAMETANEMPSIEVNIWDQVDHLAIALDTCLPKTWCDEASEHLSL